MPEDLLADVSELIHDAERCGVEMDIDYDDEEGPRLWLSSIARTSGKSGSGSNALAQLLDLSEQYDIAVAGAIEPPNQRLEQFYIQHGFDITQEGDRTLINYIP